MTQTETKNTQITIESTARMLSHLLPKCTAAQHQRIAAHLREVTGRNTNISLFLHDATIPEDTRIKQGCLIANTIAWGMKKPEFWDQLKGGVANGDRRIDPAEIVNPDPVDSPITPSTPTPAAADPAPEQPPSGPAHPRFDIPEIPGDSLEAIIGNRVRKVIAEGLEPVIAGLLKSVNPQAPELDAGLVTQLAESVFDRKINNGGFPKDKVAEMISESLGRLALRVEFVTASGAVRPLTGLMHPQVPQIASWLRAGVPVWAWGAAGSGKTHMARQIAEMLEVTPYVVSVDPTLTVAKLLGYRNVTNGDFVEGFLYRAFKEGGLAVLDEIDTGDPGVIASINALISNTHYLFPNGETVPRSEKFFVAAMANTKGTGAVAGYTARNRLDAATLDRFAVIEMKYDPGLEWVLACGVGAPAVPWKAGPPASQETQEAFVKWVQQLRASFGNSVLLSQRASINGCRALRAGVPLSEVAEALIFKLVTPDSERRMKDSHPIPEVA